MAVTAATGSANSVFPSPFDVTRDAEAPTEATSWFCGQALGRYIVRRQIGRGGMGEVVAAYDPKLDREVAIKLVSVRGGTVEERRDARSRLQQEAQALARLSHPNVVEVYDVQPHVNELAVVMALVPGQTLRQWASDRKPWPQVLALMIQAGRGLAAAHAAGIVHRDFKPGNVIVDGQGCPRVLDFGLARLMGLGDVTSNVAIPRGRTHASLGTRVRGDLTATGLVLGTPGYMAPEQHLGLPTDERADQFAFCVTLYELVYGQRPFIGKNYEALKQAVLEGKLEAAPASGAPRRLLAILTRGLQLDPQQRYPSMAALLSDLERLQRRRGRWAVAAVAPLAAVGIGFASFSEPSDACTGGDDLRRYWQTQGQPEGQRTFAALGAFAQTQWRRVEPELGRYVDRWAAAYQPACGAAQAHEIDIVRDQTMLCLQSMRRQFQTVTQVLAEAETQTALRASEVVRNLPDPSTCELEAVRAGVANEGPDDAWAQRARTIDTLLVAGSFKRAAPLVAALLEETPPEDLVRRARAQLLHGILQLNAAQSPEAIGILEDAVILARQAKSDAIAARAAVELTYHLGQNLAQYDAARVWARHALAYLQRIPEDRELAARLLNALGNVVDTTERLGNALPYYHRALELLGEESTSPLLARTWNNIGNVHIMLENDAEAEHACRRSHEVWVRALGEDHPDVLMPLNNLAMLQIARQNLQEGKEHLERVLAGWTAAYGESHPKLATPLANLTLIAAKMGECERSLELGRRGLALFEDDHPVKAKLLAVMAEAHQCLRQWQQCAELSSRSAFIFEKVEGPTSWSLSNPLDHLAACLLEVGESERALEVAERACRIDLLHWDETISPHSFEIKGRALLALGRFEEARQEFHRVLAFLDKREPSMFAAERAIIAQLLAKIPGASTEARAVAPGARASSKRVGAKDESEATDPWFASEVRPR